MDNNVIVIRSPQEIAAEINAIRRRAARQLLEDSVEVGRLLVEAKSSVGHGEWGGWLEENFQYSSTVHSGSIGQATRRMNIIASFPAACRSM